MKNSHFAISLSMLLILLFPISVVSQTQYEMLVSSRNTHSVKRYNAQTGAYIDDFIPSGSGGLSTTQDIKIGATGDILVSGRGNTKILQFDKTTGNFIMNFTSGYTLDNPTKISFGPDGNLYVSQWGTGNSCVARFNGVSGQFINEFTPDLNLPLGHTWDSAGNLYVACYGSKDVRKFDTSGNFISIFTEAGHLQGPTNLWFDGNGNMLVIDWVLGVVQKFRASDGVFISTFASGLQNAEGYAYGPDSNLYICDWSQNNVKRYNHNGTFLGVFSMGGNLAAPNSILFRPSKVISVEEGSTNAANEFTLGQNFPNPFNPSTKINFTIPKPVNVRLEIYSITGEFIEGIINQKLKPGKYEYSWNAGDYPSGIYYYKLSSENRSESKKMVLVK